MKTVGVIQGRESYFEHQCTGLDLKDLFDGGSLYQYDEAGNGSYGRYPDWANIKNIIDMVADANNGPALLFCLLNGRRGSQSIHGSQKTKLNSRQPLFVGSSRKASDEHKVLQGLIKATQVQGKPVTAFFLTAQDPTYIRRYTQQLPAGSVVIAAKTKAEDYANSTFLNLLNVRNDSDSSYEVGGRDILVTYLLSGMRMQEKPVIAISGKRPMHLNDLWNRMSHSGGISAAARVHLRDMQKHLTSINFHVYSDICGRIDDVIAAGSRPQTCTPANPAAYAAAVLTLWDKLVAPPFFHRGTAPQNRQQVVQPTHSTGSVSSGQTPPIHQDGVSTGIMGRSKNLSASDLGRPPPNLRKIAQSAPGTVRRILRKN